MVRRIFYFVLTNLAVIVVLGIVLSIFRVEAYFYGLNLGGLLVFSFVFGMIGALISLAISRWSAKMMTGAKVIMVPTNEEEEWLIREVRALTERAGLPMPEIAIYPSPHPNAFATGPSKKRSLVAVSSGLLKTMTRSEVKGVLAHEVAHIKNGDMITLALVQGVINTFVIFFSRIVGFLVDKVIFRNEDEYPGLGYFLASLFFEIVFGILASIIVLWFSRQREFRADEGGARLTDKKTMINALKALKEIISKDPISDLPQEMKAFGVRGDRTKKSVLSSLFSTHPDLDERIERLEKLLF